MSSRAEVTRSFPCFLREYLSGKVVLASGVERCSSGEIKRYVRFLPRGVSVHYIICFHLEKSAWHQVLPDRPLPVSLESCIFPCVDKDILVWQIKELSLCSPSGVFGLFQGLCGSRSVMTHFLRPLWKFIIILDGTSFYRDLRGKKNLIL